MPIPSVTCGVDQTLEYSSAGARSINLSASATNPPITSWRWDILSVPEGSTANVGNKGSFVNGVATLQNPTLLIDNAIDGTYVLQCIATNSTGPSNPSTDKQNAQQLILVRTATARLILPNDYAYDWGKNILIQSLRKIEESVGPRSLNLYTLPPIKIYVDETGDDANDGKSWGAALKTLEVAWYLSIPPIVSRKYVITFKGAITNHSTLLGQLGAKIITEAGSILIQGEDGFTTLGGGYTATSISLNSVADSTASWTPNEHAGKMVWVAWGALYAIRGVIKNTANTLFFNAPLQSSPSLPATFSFVRPKATYTGNLRISSDMYGSSPRSLILTHFYHNGNVNIYSKFCGMCNVISTGTLHIEGAGPSGDALTWLRCLAIHPDTGEDITDGIIKGGIMIPASASIGMLEFVNTQVIADGFHSRGVSLDHCGLLHFGSKYLGGKSRISNSVGVGLLLSNGTYNIGWNSISDMEVDGAVGCGVKIIDSLRTRFGPGTDVKNTSGSPGHGIYANNANVVLTNLDRDLVGYPVTGSDNAGLGVYSRNKSSIRPRLGFPPTLTGTEGDVGNHAGVATWNDIDAGGSLIDIGEMQFVKSDDATED